MKRVIVIGGGIVGLAVAELLSRSEHSVTVLEKEGAWAAHQTGHNSGVIHAGPYYVPGSLKARMCRAGNRSMVEFAEQNDIPYAVGGKLIVAVGESEIPRLEKLHERALANGANARMISASEAHEYEPHVNTVRALRVEDTGIIDYSMVSRRLAELAQANGAVLVRNAEVSAIRTVGDEVAVSYSGGEVTGDLLVNCAGLQSDRIAALAGVEPDVRIVPFRGEYYELAKDRRDLVRGLIYPVPDPALPFLGVHLTRMIDGSVHAGPNAVLAFSREGYRWRDISLKDTLDAVSFPGFLRLARSNVASGAQEIVRSLSK
ncbi:L-2-hydroxyglutarate oxidase, partial [Agreia sp.]|uniref:L-2-hydroxyglutarate oxidase n=1 Tax=Agreia sp. TaxID=1872416 RepID=UPI0035BC5BC9